MIVATRSTGLLRTFNESGFLDVADVQAAMRFGRLGGESDEVALLAVGLCVAALRAGSVCLELARMRELPCEDEIDVDALPWPSVDDLLAAIKRSPLVLGNGTDPLAPLRLVDDELLYLTKYFDQERTIARILDDRAGTSIDVGDYSEVLAELFPTPAPDRQRIAAGVAVSSLATVVAGGPGTGKTHTVARILAALYRDNPGLRVALAAPTGKAAAQLEDAVRGQAKKVGLPELPAVTLHRLLGGTPSAGSRFTFGADNRLPYDVVVVDECSMVAMTMMYRLVVALRPTTRLILVGDPEQLASVDAGAVLSDLVARGFDGTLPSWLEREVNAAGNPDESPLTEHERAQVGGGIVRLSVGRRFNEDIADLAAAVREGDGDRTIDILTAGGKSISFGTDRGSVQDAVLDVFARARAAAESGDAEEALRITDEHRILCAHRDGVFGVGGWERDVTRWLGIGRDWVPGQPLIVNANDYDVNVFNGDTGVMVTHEGVLMAAFTRASGSQLVHPARLASATSAFALTIHRSQGSQYDTVSVVLPGEKSSLLTRELLYTAITRAKKHVRIIGTEEGVKTAVNKRVLRASGLRRT
ncbi:exodeoxyribonuclease V subunit alpha [Smaragdicoccus niigatensis]|uniref:exodeoxyribonuclease V subunit alpha n=1 Tax=Smaragdicoccus niigatensis TaxID=359359 RepID=UPI000379ECCB|nr:exodeoxyribonuclease V subunit alpha [Smaragdicoccus niigatensis]